MAALISNAQVSAIRAALEVTLTHTATVTARAAGAEDGHGDAAPTTGTVTTGVPCRYETIQRAVRDGNGVTLVSVSSLTVSATGPIALGVQVTNVRDQLGGVLAAGPLLVARVLDDTAGLGAPLLPAYELSAADVELR